MPGLTFFPAPSDIACGLALSRKRCPRRFVYRIWEFEWVGYNSMRLRIMSQVIRRSANIEYQGFDQVAG